jgi:8-oxo-dGTP diphosphatase/putative hydrolase of the HAD superfamily
MNLSWIFFDLGSTLVDESGADLPRFETVRKMLAESGMAVTQADLLRCYEDAATDGFRRPFIGMLKRLAVGEDFSAEIDKAAPYQHGLEKLHEGAAACLESLAGRYKLGVIANQSAGAEDRLRNWAVHHHFSLVLSSAEVGIQKPDPKIFEMALAKAACAPGQAVMVGDRLDNDMGPAKQLGFRTIRVRQGVARFQEPWDEFTLPDRTVWSLAEVPAAVESLENNPNPEKK